MLESRTSRRWVQGVLGAVGAVALAAISASGCSQGPEPGAVSRGVPDLPAGYTRLSRGVPAVVRGNGAVDRGLLDPETPIAHLSMAFRLSPAQLADREALKAALADPSSPSYRKFLTPSEYAARFGAPRATLERAKSWLASQGLQVHEDSPLGTRVTFSGTADKLMTAFQADMRRYEVAGELHYAMSAPPALPVELAGAVAEITNTHDFHPKPMHRRSPTPDFSTGKSTGFAPPDWANVYDVTPLYTTGVGGKVIDGTGVTIAVVGVAAIAQSDIDAWRTKFSLPPSTVTMTLVPDTGNALRGSGGTGFEAVLDVEWSGGIAPGATVNYVFTGGSDGNVDDATYYAIDNNLGGVLSESWGGCEGYYVQYGLGPADQNLIDIYGSAANVLGITYVAASGDDGAATCGVALGAGAPLAGLYVSLPGAYPGVTSVGGTQFIQGSVSGTPYFTAYSNQERVWDESSTAGKAAAGGGGISVLFDRPSYQIAVPTCGMVGSLPVPGINPASQRMVPDVAFTAASGGSNTLTTYMECTIATGGDCSATGGNPKIMGGGGTSFATPAFAGVVALMSQAAGGRLGNINPLLYNLGASTPSAFHDVATGNNEITCQTGTDPGCMNGVYGFPATTGYDCATGLGSMDVYNAVNAIAGQAATTTALVVSPTSTTEGTPVMFTATVTVPKPNVKTLGGVVTFAFESYDQSSHSDLSWTLGTGTISGGTTAQGTATFTGAVPPGLVKPGTQSVNVYASYGGDAAHLPSTSAAVPLTFGALSFAIQPTAPTVAPGAIINFTATGGVSPLRWYTGKDTTCNTANPQVCSDIKEATGVFTAGPVGGTTDVFVLDADGAEAMTTVTVVCTALTACPSGANCGTMSDGCGGTLTCGGNCSSPQTCGGGGTANQCGCKPATTCPSGDVCGTAMDGCGGMITCGTCSTGQTCSNNQCVSTSSSSSSSSGATSSSSSGAGTGGTAASSSSSSGGGTVVKSGCGCRTAGDAPDGGRTTLSAFGMLALVGALRGRARRRTR